MDIREFEDRIFAQKSTEADHYDEEYFLSDWRDGDNDYSLETRRKIEGRNPELIRSAFQPERVLDVGCGPGALMHLLWELDVNAEGVDFSAAAKASAPDSIRDRITTARCDGEIPLGRDYDLVICREVMEHLTVHEIVGTVDNLCRLSRKFIYVTTRFAKQSDEFLALEIEPEVDPSHISLLNKDFLRMLFLLRGFRSRPDLEAKMDWKNYGRVLVLEHAD